MELDFSGVLFYAVTTLVSMKVNRGREITRTRPRRNTVIFVFLVRKHLSYPVASTGLEFLQVVAFSSERLREFAQRLG